MYAITLNKRTGLFDLVGNVAREMGATEQEVAGIHKELGVEDYVPPPPRITRVAELDDTYDLDGIE